MSLQRAFTVLSAAAAMGFLVTMLARPALLYARYHQPSWAPWLDVLGTAGLVLGCATLPTAILALRRLRGADVRRGPGAWLPAVVLPLVLIASGALLGFGLDWLGAGLERESRLWLRMGRDAVLFAPAVLFAAWLWYRGPPGLPRG